VYYDYVKKEYQTVYSLPIPITVTPGGLVDAADMQTRSAPDSPASSPRTAKPGENDAFSLGANHTTLGAIVTRDPLAPGAIIAILLSGPGAILAVWAGRAWRARRRPLTSVRRQRREFCAALEQVAGRDDFYVALAELVQSYLRLTFDLPPGEISAQTLAARMDRRHADGELRQAVEELLSRCDAGRFTAAGTDRSEKARLVEQARQLFARLDQL
jgi:hypothetical protein